MEIHRQGKMYPLRGQKAAQHGRIEKSGGQYSIETITRSIILSIPPGNHFDNPLSKPGSSQLHPHLPFSRRKSDKGEAAVKLLLQSEQEGLMRASVIRFQQKDML